MDAMADILQELSDTEIAAVRDLYKKDWPYGIYIHYFLDVVLRWKQDHGYPMRFFSPDGQWNDGTIITTYERDYISVACFTQEKSNARLLKALQNTKLIPWEKQPSFVILHKDQTPTVIDAILKHSYMPRYYNPGGYWWIPKETAAKYEITIPAGTYLGPLNVSHTEQIHAVWPHRKDGPARYIEKLIEYNGGIGLFQTADDSLSAWIMRNDYGALAILQTEEKHQGKGYAKVVTKALCKEFASRGIDPTAFIIIGNTVSETLFKKLGFEIINYLGWLGIKPIN